MLNSEDEPVREGIRQALMARRQQDSATITEIWCKLLDVRQAVAQKNGFSSYLDYRWQEMERYDYTPEDSRALHKAFRDYWSPLYERITTQKKEASSSEEKVQPFTDGADLVAKVGRLFHRLDPEFGAQYDHALKIGLLDITTRVNTAPVGGFARAVGRTGVFVMLNVSPGDITGLIHEMGHSFSLVATGKQPYHFFYGFPYDFGETPSSAMEMLSMPYWDEFYQGTWLEENKRGYFTGVLLSSLQDVMIEAFQLWVYSHTDEAREPADCTAKWLELHQTYLPNGDWQAHQDETMLGWQYSAAPFYAPLFAMEYVYGRLAGLNLLKLDDAVARYKKAIALGSSVSAKELFAALGTRFFFTANDVAAAAKQIESHVNTLPITND
jgi:oligoendopeptidase F